MFRNSNASQRDKRRRARGCEASAEYPVLWIQRSGGETGNSYSTSENTNLVPSPPPRGRGVVERRVCIGKVGGKL